MTALRCKPGDLAVVVRTERTPQMLGHFVIVDRLISHGEKVGPFHVDTEGRSVWLIRSAVTGRLLPWPRNCGRHVAMVSERVFADDGLRPIRPNDGEDETLTDERFRVEDVA